MCTKNWLAACLFKLAQEKSVVRLTDRPTMTIAVNLGNKATKQTNKPTANIMIMAVKEMHV